MADWGPTVVQILATPVITAGVTYAAASAVVRRQSAGAKQVEALNAIRATTAKLILEADTFIYRQQWTQHGSITELYLQGFHECADILDARRQLPALDRAKLRRYCTRMYGRHTVAAAEFYPRESTDFDKWADVGIEHKWITNDAGTEVIEAAHSEIGMLMAIFGNKADLIYPKDTDRKPEIDLQGRGLVNVFRLAGTNWGLRWPSWRTDIQMPVAKTIADYSRAAHDLNLSAIWR